MTPRLPIDQKLLTNNMLPSVIKRRRDKFVTDKNKLPGSEDYEQSDTRVELLSKEYNELRLGLDPSLVSKLNTSRHDEERSSQRVDNNVYVVSLNLKQDGK